MELSCNRTVKLLVHNMKVAESVLDRKLLKIVMVNKMQFGFMPKKETIDAEFIMRRPQEEYHAKSEKFYICSVDLEKAFQKVPGNVFELAIKKKGIPKVFVRSVMSLNKEAKTRVRFDSELSDELEVKVGMYYGSVPSSFIFAVVVDVVTKLAKEGRLSELLYADNIVFMSDTIEDS